MGASLSALAKSIYYVVSWDYGSKYKLRIKIPTILHTRPSNKRFIIQLEEYNIELSKWAYFFLSRKFAITISITQLQVCFHRL